jgi:phosphate-selective porin OprO/OprP
VSRHFWALALGKIACWVLVGAAMSAWGWAQGGSPSVASASTTSDPGGTDASKPAITFGSSGLIFSSRDGGNQLRVHGYVQADNRMFTESVSGRDYDQFLFRRIRPLFEGTVLHSIDFRFMPDFGQNNPQIQEAFMEWRSLAWARVRVGKFKEPLGLEVLKSDRELTFAERSLASDLVPLRYMGAQIGASVWSNSLTYAAGYFNGSNDGANGNFSWLPANEAAARVFVRPFARTHRKLLEDFGLGVAGSAGHDHGSIAGLKTPGQTTFFKYSSTAVADGQHNRLVPQAYYYAGPMGLMGEYAASSQQVLNKSMSRRLRNEAWQAAGSVMLTGEKNSYSGVRPRASFDPRKGLRHFGAIELAARYAELRIDANTFSLFANPQTAAQRATERAIGFNWYWNNYVKLVTDYEHTTFNAAAPSANLHSEHVLMSRIQLAF